MLALNRLLKIIQLNYSKNNLNCFRCLHIASLPVERCFLKLWRRQQPQGFHWLLNCSPCFTQVFHHFNIFVHSSLHGSLFSLFSPNFCWLQELEGTWLAQGRNAKSEHSLQQRVQQQMISLLEYKFALKYNNNGKLLLWNLVINFLGEGLRISVYNVDSTESAIMENGL